MEEMKESIKLTIKAISYSIAKALPYSILTAILVVVLLTVTNTLGTQKTTTASLEEPISEAEESSGLQEEKNNTLDNASLEELISEVEERTSNPTMETICLKLASYAKCLDDGVRFGVIALSEEEMQVLREYMKNNFQKAPSKFNTYLILGTTERIGGIGFCQYKDYKFILHIRRQVSFIGPEFRKPVSIVNSIDHPDKVIEVYKKTVRDLSDGYMENELYNLYSTSEASYTYYRDEETIILEKWKFGVKQDEWSCKAWESDNVWYGAPKVLYWKEDEDEYSFISEAHLLIARNGKITVLADDLDYDTNVATLPGDSTKYLYITDEELHQVDINSLEDIIVTEEYPQIFEQLS